MRSRLLAALCALSLSACVGVTFGDYPEASGVGVVVGEDSHAKLERPEFSVDVSLEGFDPDWGLVGLGIPLFPVGPWKWLGYVPKSDLRVTARLALDAKTSDAALVPGSARIVVGGREFAPTEVRIAACQTCGGKMAVANPLKPMPIIYKTFLELRFKTCPPPEEPFSLEIAGLPRIDYTLVSHVRWAVMGQ